MQNFTAISEQFRDKFQSAPDVICHAPGRVNLIGDHTDYNQGFVLPAAINFATCVAASKRDDSLVNVYALDYQGQSCEFILNQFNFDHRQMWSNYVQGTLQALLNQCSHVRGANIVVTGDVPQGAGLSSSASFEMAMLKAFSELYQLNLDGELAAKLGQQAENDFVGCNCGIMDQLVSAIGKKQHAILLDCRDLSHQAVAIPEHLSLFIVNSNIKRGLVDSEYNLRRQQCEQVAALLGKSSLRDVTLAELSNVQSELTPTLFKRARHVICENERTTKAFNALKHNDVELLSKLMSASHRSLRDDFAVSTKEIDSLVAIIAKEVGEQGGVRMTGGGFGGCVIAIVPTSMVVSLTAIVEQEYLACTGIMPSIYHCTAEQGAFR